MKQTYGRGAGNALRCRLDKQLSRALCYPPCDPTYNGIEPVCWSHCPQGWTTCGALCVLYAEDCVGTISDLLTNTIEIIVGIFEKDPAQAIEGAFNLATGFKFPICSYSNSSPASTSLAN